MLPLLSMQPSRPDQPHTRNAAISPRLHSTNPLERLNREIKRRADVVGIFPSEQSIIRLIGAVLLEQNDEWQLQHRTMQVKGMAGLIPPLRRLGFEARSGSGKAGAAQFGRPVSVRVA